MTEGNISGHEFPVAEFEHRLARAHEAMAASGFDALLLTTAPEVQYFSGFRTLFWQSPTRPWFLVVPRDRAPIAIVPQIGAALMARTWVEDIRTWSAPAPDDDGISLLADALSNARQIGLPMGRESHLRMPLNDFTALRERLPGTVFADATPLIDGLRQIKSDREVDVIRAVCTIASDAFDAAPKLFHSGLGLDAAFRRFRIALLECGADDVPYLVGGAGPGGYLDVISPPYTTPLADGDVLMLDTGAALGGYHCDFDRNFAIGHASDKARRGYATLQRATDAALDVLRPGATCATVFDAMAREIGSAGDVGRFGHGLGLQLTETPSLIGFDETPIRPGMVMTIEPSLDLGDGRMMVTEENALVTEDQPVLLSRRAPPELPVI